uniref:helix-turn-helix domain-containing protein n=1 Tax=Rhodococcus sp. UNC363MFTsu5.1 TaxID=1449069 RepID=UPI000480050C
MQIARTNAIVGARIAELRAIAEMSQAQLAQKLASKLAKDSIDPTTITRLERGSRPITVVELVALAEIFGLPTESLIPKTRIVEQHL